MPVLAEIQTKLTIPLRVLMVTSEWPTLEHPEWVPFIVQQVKYLQKTGVEVEVFSFRGNKNPINYIKAWLKFRSLYDIEQFNLIHAQWGQSGLIALPTRVPLVVTFHGSDLQGIVGSNGRYTLKGKILQLLSKYVAKRAKEIVVVGENLVKYLPSRLPVHVIPEGVDLSLFSPIPQQEARRQLGLPLNKCFVLFASDPHKPVKRYHLAQEAIKLVKNQLNIELVTIFNVAHNLVPIYMNACDVLVLTSKHEGSPTVVKEALACNLPIVSVDVGDVRERIENVQGCILCGDDSPETIASGLAQVLRVKHRINAHNAITDLDEQKVVQRLIEVYCSVLADSQ